MEKYYKKCLELELIDRTYWIHLCNKPMRGYSNKLSILYRAVQEWESQEQANEIAEIEQENNQLHMEVTQMNQQFHVSKRQKIEAIEDDVIMDEQVVML